MPVSMIVSIGRVSLRRSGRPVPAPERSDAVGGRTTAQIATGAGQALVTELGLDDLRREPLGGQLDGVAVAQPLGVDPFGEAGLLRQAGKELPDVGRLERASRQGAEQR